MPALMGVCPLRLRVARFALCLAACAASVGQAGDVYRCDQDGRTTYSDTPCPVARTASPATPGAPDSATAPLTPLLPPAFGDWHGQAQYQLFVADAWVDEAHAVVALTLSLSHDGKVAGASPDNGCRLLGLWTPSYTASVLALDVSLSHCSYAGLNHRYQGQLAETADGRNAQLTLTASNSGTLAKPLNAELKANLRR